MPQPSTCVSRCSPSHIPCHASAGSATTRGAVKLRVRLDTRAYCRPACCRQAFVALTEGRTHDLSAARALQLPKGSIVVMDRGYNDYAWYKSLNNNGISFVTWLKTNAQYRIIKRRTMPKNKGLTCVQTIEFTGARIKNCPVRLRRIGNKDANTGSHYIFLIDNLKGISKNCQFEQFGDCN